MPAEPDLEEIHPSTAALQLRSLVSFSENVTADPDLAVPFLHLFPCGDPN